ncbi:hypothetical protein [Telluribacter humicola]|uniref:hypothetical protein n=1 Tax=Telluribacter humicola TaxID=1720261 RepID=UPI001A959DAE|nr:hypothetical protein [Telluribacter humicola]
MNEYHSSLHLPIKFILSLAGLFLIIRMVCWLQNIHLHAMAPIVDGYILFVAGLLLAHYIDDYFGWIPKVSKK